MPPCHERKYLKMRAEHLAKLPYRLRFRAFYLLTYHSLRNGRQKTRIHENQRKSPVKIPPLRVPESSRPAPRQLLSYQPRNCTGFILAARRDSGLAPARISRQRTTTGAYPNLISRQPRENGTFPLVHDVKQLNRRPLKCEDWA